MRVQVQHVVSTIALITAQKLSLEPSKLMGSGSVWVKVLHPIDVDRQTHIFDVEVSSEHICNYVLFLEKNSFYTSLLTNLLKRCPKGCVLLPSAFPQLVELFHV